MEKKRTGGGTLTVILIGVAVGYFVLAWPYHLGAWLAVQLGAGLPSPQRSVLAWAFEVLYVLVLAAVGARRLWLRSRRAQDPPPPFDEDAADRVLAMIDGATGSWADPRVPDDERVRAVLNDVRLVEPRREGGATVPAVVGTTGVLLLTDRAARFHGSEGRTRVWRWDEVTRVTDVVDHVKIAVSSRTTESGVMFLRELDAAGRTAIRWSVRSAQGAGPDELGQIGQGLRDTARSAREQVAAEPEPPRPLSRRTIGTAVAAVVLAALLSTGAVAVWIGAAPPAPSAVAAAEVVQTG
ncbi:hypothetical protein V5D56_03755 [Cellulosimicrobium sp. PMB13]|uniref:hypothetical protein n=1 Tax=Cellulosimicrobium sp. PMB13 TaxID=3120158 RepID=UPI003F4B3DFC